MIPYTWLWVGEGCVVAVSRVGRGDKMCCGKTLYIIPYCI